MKKKPLITVILPIYNVEEYIEECLDSLLNQTIGHKNLEVIMVNDCSKDNTGTIIDRYASRYENFKAIHLEKNSGAPGKPRNIGIEHATGEYLIFLDPDDYIPADAYETLYKLIKEDKCDFVMGKMKGFDESDGREFEHSTFKDYLLQKSYTNVNIKDVPFFLQVKTAMILKLVKTEFVKKNNIKFIEGMRNGEDKYYDIQLFTKAKKFSYIPKVIYMYRSRNDENNRSLTQQDIVSTVENDVRVAKTIRQMLNKNQYEYFQINVFRSILWKICDTDFNKLNYNKKIYLLNLIRDIVLDYNKDIAKRYFSLEEPILSLLNKGFIEEALDYNSMLISRRWWYKVGIEQRELYLKQQKIRDSFSWRITKPLRNKMLFNIKKLVVRGVRNEDKHSSTTV